jgi:branched-chain amino acid transport system substrate-binding protein
MLVGNGRIGGLLQARAATLPRPTPRSSHAARACAEDAIREYCHHPAESRDSVPSLPRRSLLALPALAMPALAQSAPLLLGALFPFSGAQALLGDESYRGLELAVEERNALGGLHGRPIRLVKGDAADPSQAASEARRLLTVEKVGLVFGGLGSAAALAASQVVELAGGCWLELGASGDSLTERGFRGLFRTCPRAADLGRETVAAVAELLAPALRLEPGALALALLHEETGFGQALANAQEAECRARHLPAPQRLGYAPRGGDLAIMLQRLRSGGSQVVLHSGAAGDIVALFRAMAELRWQPRMLVGVGAGYGLADTAQALGPAGEGVLVIDSPPYEVKEHAAPGARRFQEEYRRRYGSAPRSAVSLASASGARPLLEAMQRAGAPDRDRLRPALLALDLAPGALANGWGMKFDDKGQNTRALPFLAQWQDGRLMTVAPRPAAVAPLRAKLGT